MSLFLFMFLLQDATNLNGYLNQDQAAQFWFQFSHTPEGQAWEQQTALLWRGQDVRQLCDHIQHMDDQDRREMIRSLDRKKDVLLDPYILQMDLEEDYGFFLEDRYLEFVQLYGTTPLSRLLMLASPNHYGFELPDAAVIPFQPAMHSWSPRWVLGSTPPTFKLNDMALKPFSAYLFQSFGTLIKVASFIFLPLVMLSFGLGLLEGYVFQCFWRHHPFAQHASNILRWLRSSIQSVPRLLLIILFVLIFRKFGTSIQPEMIAIPLAISAFPAMSDRTRDSISALGRSDGLALRRSQGFSHRAILWECLRFRMFTLPIQEMINLLTLFLYTDCLVEFLICLNDDAMSGLYDQSSLGYMMVTLGISVSTSRHQSFSPEYMWHMTWFPLLCVLTVFLGLIFLFQLLKRRFQ